MQSSSQRKVVAVAVTAVAVAALAAAAFAPRGAGAQEPEAWRNVTTGGPLRPGVYGRIVVRGDVPPPVIYPVPTVADDADAIGPRTDPVYLYVPPGQVRKWKQNCARWSACEQPVLFVRVDDSPSRWGRWRALRAHLALHDGE